LTFIERDGDGVENGCFPVREKEPTGVGFVVCVMLKSMAPPAAGSGIKWNWAGGITEHGFDGMAKPGPKRELPQRNTKITKMESHSAAEQMRKGGAELSHDSESGGNMSLVI
jgi:hypothetical protein